MNDRTDMLSCEELRRLKLVDPRRPTAAMENHVANCPPCAEFASSVDAVESRLEAAANVRVPDSLVARALDAGKRARRPGKTRRLRWPKIFGFRLSLQALAALSAVVAISTVSAMLGIQLRDSQRLALDVIAMVHTDNAAPPPPTEAARIAARRLLASYGIRLTPAVSDARYVGPCQVRGVQGAYIALFTEHGEARLILLPLDVRWRAMSSASGLAAIVIPADKGAVAVVATSTHTADEVARLLL